MCDQFDQMKMDILRCEAEWEDLHFDAKRRLERAFSEQPGADIIDRALRKIGRDVPMTATEVLQRIEEYNVTWPRGVRPTGGSDE